MTIARKKSRVPLDVDEMRRAFDQSFALPDRIKTIDIEDFLAIRAGAGAFVMRVAELDRIEIVRKLAILPGASHGLLGLASCQGKLVPVYSLEVALGFDRTPGEKRWLAVCGGDEPLGLAFDALEGYLRIPRSNIFSTGPADSVRKPDQQAVRDSGQLQPVVHLPSIIAAIRGRVDSDASQLRMPG